MTVDVSLRRLPLAPGHRLALTRPARLALAGVVSVGFAARWLLAFGHPTPYHMPDEYIYVSLARGFAETGRPIVRGAQAHFPALLEPLLAAPFWLPGDAVLAYRLTQGLHALAMSLAAVPVYLLARRIGLGSRFAIVCGALAVLSPETGYSSFVMADPIAYPLALWALYAGVSALSAPTRRGQLVFLGLCGLATFARIQYVILPAAFLLAGLAVEDGSLLRRLARFRPTIACLALGLGGVLVVGSGRVLGYYHGVLGLGTAPGDVLHWLLVDSLLLAYASGWILVPAALVAIASGIARARSREERAFAAFATAFGAGLFLEAALYASNGSARFQERYLIALVPLVPIAFGLAQGRSRRAVAALGLIGFALAATVPLSGYAERAGSDSQFLSAVHLLGQLIGVGDAAFVVSLVAGALSLAAVVLAGRTRAGAVIGLALTACIGMAVSAGAVSLDRTTSKGVREAYLPADLQWVDHARVGHVALLQTRGADAGRSLDQLFWNRSIQRVLLVPGARAVDKLGSTRIHIANSGQLMTGDRTLRAPLLVPTAGSSILMSGALRVSRGPGFELWRPAGMPRLALLAAGRDQDGWLAAASSITVWPGSRPQLLRLGVTVPPGLPAEKLVLRAPGLTRVVSLPEGSRRTLSITIRAGTPFRMLFSAGRSGRIRMDRLALEPARA